MSKLILKEVGEKKSHQFGIRAWRKIQYFACYASHSTKYVVVIVIWFVSFLCWLNWLYFITRSHFVLIELKFPESSPFGRWKCCAHTYSWLDKQYLRRFYFLLDNGFPFLLLIVFRNLELINGRRLFRIFFIVLIFNFDNNKVKKAKREWANEVKFSCKKLNRNLAIPGQLTPKSVLISSCNVHEFLEKIKFHMEWYWIRKRKLNAPDTHI